MKGREMRLVSAFAAICSAALLCVGAQAGTAAPPDEAALAKALDRLVAAGVPGAVLLVRDGNRTIRLASGYSVVAGHVRAQPGDRFRIGSVTKSFVATVVLQLAGEQKLRLDDTVAQLLPGKLRGGTGITVRQLLQQTSGLPDYLGDPRIFRPYLQGNARYAWTPSRLLAIANSHDPRFPPGSRWEYSNTNYLVLGLIVEAVTRNTLARELKQRVFDPAGLRSTTFDTQPTIPGQHMHGYFPLNGRLTDTSVLSLTAGWAAGAIVSTADDVAQFYRALLQGRLLGAALLRQMESTVSMGLASNDYGLGIWRTGTMALTSTPFRCGAAWGHNGDWIGYNTNAFNSKDGTRQFVLFVNRDEAAFTPKIKQAIFAIGSKAYC
jgi:D-alanyl-D-alanine carboxypeptidase